MTKLAHRIQTVNLSVIIQIETVIWPNPDPDCRARGDLSTQSLARRIQNNNNLSVTIQILHKEILQRKVWCAASKPLSLTIQTQTVICHNPDPDQGDLSTHKLWRAASKPISVAIQILYKVNASYIMSWGVPRLSGTSHIL